MFGSDRSGRCILVRSDGMFVAPRGSSHSYVQDLRRARRFATREDAEHDRCPGNEYISTIDAQLDM
jgi:hypothetical protein